MAKVGTRGLADQKTIQLVSSCATVPVASEAERDGERERETAWVFLRLWRVFPRKTF
jgi:hypothetical protein